MKKICVGTLAFFGIVSAFAQEKPLDMKMDFEDYDPPSTLVVPEHVLTRAKYPFIDVHNHQWNMPTQDLNALLKEMDALNMAVMVNLSGRGRGSTEHLERSLENVNKTNPKRLIVFTNMDFAAIDDPEWQGRMLKQLEDDVKKGANGLKIFKTLGMFVNDSKGNRIHIDDPRLDPIWDKCGALGIPVLIHSADPKSFWDPIDKNNERWLELKLHPGRRHDTDKVSWETIIEEQHNMFRKHPKTKFINAHMGWYGSDLKKLGALMDQLPNMYAEIGAVIAELGRQPRAGRDFLIKYQDRVMFGKDSWVPEEYATYFRVLETADDYFPYHKRYHAFWRMYGLALPDEVLKKIYYKNALKVIPHIDASLFPK
ncbi:amidohydrolase family protein [Chryseolinea sp. Jin1]|uniref:Amidohydrolase family protein n=2 Tax=Chryseolinea lacunae TaxID=2801331 RepID=A0ABS1KTT2_9BACT|nr:amidohydrolase family protein [Chryseolinea lacunae]